MKTNNTQTRPYELYIGTVTGTGWPIDGHRMVFGIWDYAKDSYALMDWDEKDDEAVMLTFFQIEVEEGFESQDNLEQFKEVWNKGEYEWPGAFHIGLNHLENAEKIDKSPFVMGEVI